MRWHAVSAPEITLVRHRYPQIINFSSQTVLHYDRGLELKPLLRSGASDEEIGRQIINALKEKPSEHHFRERTAGEELPDGVEEQRKMVQIGG